MNNSYGVFQSDVVLRTAILAGLAELRSKTWLIDFAFAGLLQDDLTKHYYGQRQIDLAKAWFLKTQVNVIMNTDPDPERLPVVSINIAESSETDALLSDTNYEDEDVIPQNQSPALAGPFQVQGYDPVSGKVTLPTSVLDQLVVSPGQVLVDDVGQKFQIVSVEDVALATTGSAPPPPNVCFIAPRSQPQFGANTSIIGLAPTQQIEIKGAQVRETYTIGIHTRGEAFYNMWLYTLILFVLYRGRKVLLEKRNFSRPTFSSQDIHMMQNMDGTVFGHERFIQATGYAHMTWPDDVLQGIESTVLGLAILDGGNVPLPADQTLLDQNWVGEDDVDMLTRLRLKK